MLPPVRKKHLSCDFSASCLAVKCPGHGSVGRRCSCEAPVRTGLCVIRHAVKDPIDLHSNCVPVGPSEARWSLHRSATGSHPRAGLREPEGGPGHRVRCGRLPTPTPSSTYSSIYTHWHVYTHSETESARELRLCVWQWVLHLHRCFIEMQSDGEGISNKEGFSKNIYFFKPFFSAADISVDDSLFNPSVPGCISIIRFCSYLRQPPVNYIDVCHNYYLLLISEKSKVQIVNQIQAQSDGRFKTILALF